MQNTSLLQVLSRLPSREQGRWRQYVHSDYFNKQWDTLQTLAKRTLSNFP